MGKGFKQWLGLAALAGASVAASGQVLTEGFDDVDALGAAGWVRLSNGSAAGDGWFQGNDGIFTAAGGAANAYAAANWVASAGSLSDWLLTPMLSLPLGGRVDFSLRLLGGGFLDTVQVYASNSGGGTDTASFSLLGSYGARSDTSWLSLTLALPVMEGRIGFRYVVADTQVDGNYAGLDSLTVIGVVPEPGSALLLCLGLSALVLRRRPLRRAIRCSAPDQRVGLHGPRSRAA